MRAGKLRHRVVLQTQATTQDAYGENTGAWSDTAEVYASIEPLVGREQIERDAETQTINNRIRLRYRSGVTPEMRVKWVDNTGGVTRYFDIESVTRPYENRRELVLLCKEVL